MTLLSYYSIDLIELMSLGFSERLFYRLAPLVDRSIEYSYGRCDHELMEHVARFQSLEEQLSSFIEWLVCQGASNHASIPSPDIEF